MEETQYMDMHDPVWKIELVMEAVKV
jgi:hypothetical protein